MILAGEVSGDMYGASLVRELRALVAPRPLEVYGIGGDRLREEGAELFAHTDETGVMGLWEVLKRFRFFKRLLRTAGDTLRDRRPDLVLTIDYPGFNLRVAAMAKALGIPVVHYVCPQVWAWHRGRVPKIARTLDRLVALFPFEPEIFKGTGLPVDFVGHPLVDRVAETRREPPSDLPWGNGHRVALFPGSRKTEISRLLPDVLSAAVLLQKEKGPCTFLIPTPTQGVRAEVERQLEEWKNGSPPQERDGLDIHVVCGESRHALLQAEAAVVKSGTSTLEAALLGCPMTIVYRLAPLSYRILRHLVTGVKFIGLVNLVAGKEVCKELIQDALTPRRLADEMLPLLEDTPRRTAMLASMRDVSAALGKEGALRRAAEVISKHFLSAVPDNR